MLLFVFFSGVKFQFYFPLVRSLVCFAFSSLASSQTKSLLHSALVMRLFGFMLVFSQDFLVHFWVRFVFCSVFA